MKKFLTIFISLGLLVLMTIPFIVPANMLFPFITGKAFVFRIVTELIFAAWLILAIAYKEYRPKCTWLLRSVILLVFFLLISDLCAINVTKALWSNFERMEGWISFIHLLAYFIVLGSFLIRERDWLWFWRANTFIGFIVGIYVVFTAGADPRLSGPLGNPIYLGIYFLFILFTSLWLWLKDSILTEKPQINWTFYLYPIVPIFSLFITYRSSRGVFLGAIGGLCLTALLILIFERTQKVLRLSAGYFFSLIIVLVLIFIGVRHSTFVANNPTLSRLAEISWSNVNGQARQYVWPIALKGFKEHPVLGWGQEGFVYVFNKYYDPRMYNQETWFDRAHNSPLDFLVAGGLLSLLTYLSLYFFSTILCDEYCVFWPDCPTRPYSE